MLRFSALVLLLAISSLSRAELVIEITRGADDALPIAIVPFAGTQASDNLASIIKADLDRSGRFRSLPEAGFPSQPSSSAEVKYAEWQKVGANHLVTGSVQTTATGQFQILRAAIHGGFDAHAGDTGLVLVAHDLVEDRVLGEASDHHRDHRPRLPRVPQARGPGRAHRRLATG